MSIGIFFFTADRFHWGPRWNFTLAAAQGLVYVPGALLSGRVAARVPPRTMLAVVYALLAAVAAAGAAVMWSEVAVVALLLTYTFVIALTWPLLEGLAARAGPPRFMARRMAVYNLVWPATGAAAMAVEGVVIQRWPAGVFLLPAAAHLVSVWLAVRAPGRWDEVPAAGAAAPADHPEPEPELLRVRTRALWISRLALPATYVVVYGLMPLMPSLPAVKRLDTQAQTLLGSTWLAARWLSFALLALTAWWHTRPRVMVAAAVLMLVAFLGTTLAPSQLWGPAVAPRVDLVAIVLWQLLLGVALGMIYSGSLYFGMVLSDGSTEHGGYHEALIGLGWMLGPAAGATTQWLRPGDVTFGVGVVGGVIAVSVLAVAGASVFVGRKGT